MDRMAIMVDGGYFHRRANALWGNLSSPNERAQDLHTYCLRHLHYKDEESDLYRIFYYDCPPYDGNIFHPLTRTQVKLHKTPLYRWMTEFHDAMRSKRKVAMRMGRLGNEAPHYVLTDRATKRLLSGAIRVDELQESDFVLSITQKGVDMKLGIDIASMAYKKQVNKIVLISGDSDFVPAAKAARREGIDFILDPMGGSISSDLQEHIDGLRSMRFLPHHNGGKQPQTQTEQPSISVLDNHGASTEQ